MKYLQRLCGEFGVLPASFTLTDGFDYIGGLPRAGGTFAVVYKATYKGQPVVAKAFTTMSMESSRDLHRVCGLIFYTIE